MKTLVLASMALGGCVAADTAVDYAQRAHPECRGHFARAHRLSGTSKTEIEMQCGKTARTITIKCEWGWGILADTTCHENN